MPSKKNKKNKSRSILKFLFVILIFFFFLGIVGIFATYKYFARDLPDLRDITGYEPTLVNEFYSSDGIIIAEYGIEKRKLIDLEDIPDHVVDSFIAIEDRRFYEHKGFDIKGILRAVIQNTLEGEVVSGASTITQQVTKNLILSPQKTYTRKIKELILSYRIEKNLSKEEILYLYLNHIYLADGNYGVQAASQNFFGKDVGKISIAEAALLAGIPKRPEHYSPRKNIQNALQRQKTVLNIMEEEGLITSKQKQFALDYKIEITPKKQLDSQIAPYFSEFARKYLEKKVGTDEYLKGGYKVFTTLDIEHNLAGQWAIRKGIYDYEKRQGRGFIVKNLKNGNEIKSFLDPLKNKEIIDNSIQKAVVTSIENSDKKISKAVVEIGDNKSSFNYFVSSPFGSAIPELKIDGVSAKYAPISTYMGVDAIPEKITIGDVINVRVNTYDGQLISVTPVLNSPAQSALISMDTNGNVLSIIGGFDFRISQFNRAIQARRQPGSSFKPLVYSAAVDKGYTETSVLYDIPVVIKDWIPSNYDGAYEGALVLRKALARSRNLASIRLIMDIDPQYVVDYSKNFGFESNLNAFPSLALGGSDVTLLEMVNAFSVFANEGIYKKPKFILRIYDRNGRIIEDNTGNKYLEYERVLTKERENRRIEIIKELAAKKGFEMKIKPEDSSDKQDFKQKPEENFLTSEEFVELVKKIPLSYFVDDENSKQVISPETAFIVTDLLKAVVNEGTGMKASRLNEICQVAGKTGTTNDYTDAWFVGFSPSIVTGVWVGKDNSTPLGRKESGSKAALPIWIDFMEDALKKHPGEIFKKPPGIKFIDTPYGNIPYKVDTIRESVIEMLKVKVNGPNNPNEKVEDVDFDNDQSEIDFLLRR